MAMKLTASAVITGLLLSASSVASAQQYPATASDRGYDQQQSPPPPSGQSASGYGNGYDDRNAPPGADAPLPPPPGYDGTRPPPPPPGYRPDPAYAADPAQDHRYEAYAEDWAHRYCVKSRSNAGTGAVIGGLFGALLGSSVSGRHDRGGGAVIGGLAGAAGGAAIGSTSAGATSPGCPPGFVVARDAPAFYYAGEGAPYYYDAPDWYRPWFFYEGRWTYRPYPYHSYYYRSYGRGGWGRGGPGRGGPGYGDHRGGRF